MKSIYKNYKISKELLPDMTYAIDQLTANQEGFGSFIMSVTSFFKKKIEAISGIFGINSKNDTKEISKETAALYKEFSKFDKTVNQTVKSEDKIYNSLRSILIPWIPGVKPDLYSLVTGLKLQVDEVQNKALPLLDQTDTFISKLLGDEDYRTSIIPNKELVDSLKKYSKDTTNYLTDIINGKQVADSREFEDVIPNMQSIETIHNILKDLLFAKDLEKVQEVFNYANKIGNNAKELLSQAQKNQLNISKVRANELGPVLQESAAIVTNVAAIIRILDASVKIHKAILEKLSYLVK
jgi:hypothetical protein